MIYHNPLEQVYALVSIERIERYLLQFPEAFLFCDADSQLSELKFDELTNGAAASGE